MRQAVMLLAFAGSLSCATRADITRLDAPVPNGRAAWTWHKGSLCDFQLQDAVCVSGVDEGTAGLARPSKRVDVTEHIVRSTRRRLTAFAQNCDGAGRHIRAEYQGGYSFMTHSTPPHLGHRWGLGFVRVESGEGWIADVVWSDSRGGSAEDVAQRFGDAFATLLADAKSARCDR